VSMDYQFKFYNPRPMLAIESVAQVLHGFVTYGVRVFDYLLGYQHFVVPTDKLFSASQVIEPSGTCTVGLSVPAGHESLEVTFQTHPQRTRGAQVTLSVEDDVFLRDPAANAYAMIELARIVNLHLPAYFGWGDHETVLTQLTEELRFDTISALAWANLFGPEMVRRIGQDRLLALPAYRVQAFKQGVLCLLTPTPEPVLSDQQAAEIRKLWPGCALPTP
jgi:hypothetical protein